MIIKERWLSDINLLQLVYEDNQYKVKRYLRGNYNSNDDKVLNIDNENQALEIFNILI